VPTYEARHEVNKIHRLLIMSEVIEPVIKMEVFCIIAIIIIIVSLFIAKQWV